MGFPLDIALRYMRSRKRAFVSVGTLFAIIGVALGTAALATVMSVTGGFRAEFREKVLGVNAHVLVLKYSSDFPEYRKVMKQMEGVPHVTGIAPFIINPMMITHKDHTATGVLLKGVDPKLMPTVLDLPRHIIEPDPKKVSVDSVMLQLRLPDAKPPKRKRYRRRNRTPKKKKGLLEQIKDLDRDAGAAKKRPVPAPSGKPAAVEDAEEDDDDDDEVPDDPNDGYDDDDDDDDDDVADAGAADAEPVATFDGGLTPDGGYTSVLPDDDDLPEDIDPDPCSDAAAVKKLPGIILGKTLKENLNVQLGDCIQVTSPTIGYRLSRGGFHPPVAKQFRVIAVFDAGFDQYDSKLAYADLYEAQAFYDAGDSVTGVEMKVDDIDQARKVTGLVEERLQSRIYHVMDWEELNHGLFTALRIQQIMMSLVLALIILVAAFTVIATLIMVVLDKKKEIGVLKAMGATDWALLRAFLYQGGIIGVIGTTLGLGLGYAVCKGLLIYGFPLDAKVYFISKLPVQVRLEEFALTGVFAVLICLLATIWPATYAARLRPAEAFREQ